VDHEEHQERVSGWEASAPIVSAHRAATSAGRQVGSRALVRAPRNGWYQTAREARTDEGPARRGTSATDRRSLIYTDRVAPAVVSQPLARHCDRASRFGSRGVVLSRTPGIEIRPLLHLRDKRSHASLVSSRRYCTIVIILKTSQFLVVILKHAIASRVHIGIHI